MKKKPASKSAFFNPRVLIGLAFCSIGLVLALLAFGLYPGGKAFARQNQSSVQNQSIVQDQSSVQNNGTNSWGTPPQRSRQLSSHHKL